jgi:hypothetical protein
LLSVTSSEQSKSKPLIDKTLCSDAVNPVEMDQ